MIPEEAWPTLEFLLLLFFSLGLIVGYPTFSDKDED